MRAAFGANNFAEFKKSRLGWIVGEVRKKNFTQVNAAHFYAENGDVNNALTALEHAADLIFIGAHPNFDTLRGEPRFQAILRRVNL